MQWRNAWKLPWLVRSLRGLFPDFTCKLHVNLFDRQIDWPKLIAPFEWLNIAEREYFDQFFRNFNSVKCYNAKLTVWFNGNQLFIDQCLFNNTLTGVFDTLNQATRPLRLHTHKKYTQQHWPHSIWVFSFLSTFASIWTEQIIILCIAITLVSLVLFFPSFCNWFSINWQMYSIVNEPLSSFTLLKHEFQIRFWVCIALNSRVKCANSITKPYKLVHFAPLRIGNTMSKMWLSTNYARTNLLPPRSGADFQHCGVLCLAFFCCSWSHSFSVDVRIVIVEAGA